MEDKKPKLLEIIGEDARTMKDAYSNLKLNDCKLEPFVMGGSSIRQAFKIIGVRDEFVVFDIIEDLTQYRGKQALHPYGSSYYYMLKIE